MNLEILKGEWTELKGKIQSEWGKLTHNELDQIDGEATKLLGLLQQKYGHSLDEAQKKVAELIDTYDDLTTKGEWNEVKGDILKSWGKLTDNDADMINGSKTRLVGILQQRYAKSKMEALAEVEKFLQS